jgi:RNA polymerase sigma-70 factor (ECF subfamily)
MRPMAAPGKQFEQRLLELQQPLYQFGLILCGSTQEAMDLVQEAFLKALRSRRSFVAGTSLKAWVMRILRNTFLDQRRRRKYEPRPSDSVDEAAAAPSRTGAASEDVRHALQRLDPDHRALVVLCDLHGFKYREIAELLDIPIGTCMSRLHRARRRLRELMGAQRRV